MRKEITPKLIVEILKDEKCPFSMYRLATMCGLTQVSLRRYVNGSSVPGDKAVSTLASFLRLDDYIAFLEGRENMDWNVNYWDWAEEKKLFEGYHAATRILSDGYDAKTEAVLPGMEEFTKLEDPRLNQLDHALKELEAAYILIQRQREEIDALRKNAVQYWRLYCELSNRQ